MAHRDLMIDSPPKVGRRKAPVEHVKHNHDTTLPRSSSGLTRPLSTSNIGEAGTLDTDAEMRIQRIKEARLLYRTPQTRSATAGKVDALLKDSLPKYHRHSHDDEGKHPHHHHSNQSLVQEKEKTKLSKRMTQSTPNLELLSGKSRIPVLAKTKFPLPKEAKNPPEPKENHVQMDEPFIDSPVEYNFHEEIPPGKEQDFVDADLEESKVEKSSSNGNHFYIPSEILPLRYDISSPPISSPQTPQPSPHKERVAFNENYIITEPLKWSLNNKEEETRTKEEDLVNYLKINRREHTFKPERWESAYTFHDPEPHEEEGEEEVFTSHRKEHYSSLPTSDVNLDKIFGHYSQEHYMEDRDGDAQHTVDGDIDFWLKQNIRYERRPSPEIISIDEPADRQTRKRENRKVLEFSIYLNGDMEEEDEEGNQYKDEYEETVISDENPVYVNIENVFRRNHIILNDPILLSHPIQPDLDDQYSLSLSPMDESHLEQDMEAQSHHYLLGLESTVAPDNHPPEPKPIYENIIVEELPAPPPQEDVTDLPDKTDIQEMLASKISRPLQPQNSKNTEKCCVCDKTVYLMEMIILDSSRYHKGCFKCYTCSTTLNTNNFYKVDAHLYCRSHYKSPSHLTLNSSTKEPSANQTKPLNTNSIDEMSPPENVQEILSITTPAGMKASTLPANASQTPSKFRSEFYTTKSDKNAMTAAPRDEKSQLPLDETLSKVNDRSEDSSADSVNVGGNQMKLVTKKEVWV